MAAEARVFISHAAADRTLVDHLVDLVQVGVGVPHEKLFCTSLEGMGIPEGMDFKEFIHDQLQNPPLVVMVITPSYYESAFCLCELGAAWAMSHSSFPLLVPPVDHRDLRAVLSNTQVRMITDPAGLDALRDRIVERLDLKSPAPTARWNVKRDEFLGRLPEILKTVPGFTKVDAKKYAESQEMYAAAQQMLKERQQEIEHMKATIENLKGLKDREQVAALMASESGKIDAFESLVAAAAEELAHFPQVVLEAMFLSYYGEPYWPVGDDSWKWEQIKQAQQDGFLVTREVSLQFNLHHTVCPNADDRTIGRALAKLQELAAFLGAETISPDFFEQYEEKHGFPADICNRRFWRGALGYR